MRRPSCFHSALPLAGQQLVKALLPVDLQGVLPAGRGSHNLPPSGIDLALYTPYKHGTAHHSRAGGTAMTDQHSRFQFSFPLWLLIGVGLMLVLPSVWGTQAREQLPYSDFKTMLRQGRIAQVQIDEHTLHGTLRPISDTKKVPLQSFVTVRVEDPGLLHDLEAQGVQYRGQYDNTVLKTLLAWLIPLSLAIVIWALLLRRMSFGQGVLRFGKSRARVYVEPTTDVTFADVADAEEAKEELLEIVDFLRQPEKYVTLGGRIPKGVLLVGPPGTGKTLLARAVAGEAHVPFFSLSGSDFVEMFVGVGAARVRDLFTQAENKAPCIVFIDELDALGKTRAGAVTGSHDEREQTLNQLLVEMDGFDPNRGVILMAATNRPETLDPALLRPGRFDRTVVVDRPDINGREAILKVHIREVRLGDDVDLRRVASLTPGLVGADLANLVNEAALRAGRAGKPLVAMADFEEAVERCAVGLERKSRIMNADEKQRVAYHEAGHALVSCLLPNTHPVHKISIIPRGVGALGYVLSRPDEDRYLITKAELVSKIKVALGGTVAEELVFEGISNGATSDLEQAINIARRMVKQFGMSRLGRVCYQEHGGPGFLNGQGGGPEGERAYSEETAREIDVEVRQIIEA